MPSTPHLQRSSYFWGLSLLIALLSLGGCSTPAQKQANSELKALNNANNATSNTNLSAPEPYLGSYGPNDPPRLSTDSGGYDQFNPGLSESVAVPFLSFLIIEPDPVSKNAIPSDVEKLVKNKQYQEAIDLINQHLKKTPLNVQLRYVKARLQIELRQWSEAKNTLIEITQQFPELPEPYNNLAALASNQGNWIEARDYLELALKLRPSYAIASANLGEVYIRLAAQAYENASKDVQRNQRQYSNRAKTLLEIVKPQQNIRLEPNSSTQAK
jgi:tetratricopeptide (TPR) repeat protein